MCVEDHVAHGAGIDAEQGQALGRAAQESALALLGHFGREAGIDHIGAGRAGHQPGVVVHRHRSVVRIAANEVIAPLRLARGITQCVDLVLRQHVRSPWNVVTAVG